MAAPPAPPRVRWGLPDVALAWVAGLIGAVVLAAVVAGVLDVSGDELADDVGVFLGSIVGQTAAVLGVLALVSRAKGRGSLRRDFGLTLRWRDGGWIAVGVGLQVVLGLAVLPVARLHDGDEAQTVVNLLEGASGPSLALFAVAVVVLAPVVEELLFRGALLRGLMRRTTPGWAIFVSAAVFALVHPLGDPEVGSVIVVPAILALGVVSGYLAARRGDLSRSIMLHAGFNLLTVLAVVAD